MSLLPPPPKTFLEKYWRLILITIFFVLLMGWTVWIVQQARIRAQDLKTLAEVNAIRNGLELYFYFRNDYPPAAKTVTEKILGKGDALCLDKSEIGFRVSCEKEAILPELPAANFIYKKDKPGDYLLTFSLKKSIDGLQDVNKNGKIDCKLTREGIECR
jgi:hypothetical protein